MVCPAFILRNSNVIQFNGPSRSMCRISSFFVCQNLDNNKLYKAGDEGFYLIIKDFDHDQVDNGQLIKFVYLHGKTHVYLCLPLIRLKILV